nr:MAG TPA: hypothetical protein [Caudoviricetes sp.]
MQNQYSLYTYFKLILHNINRSDHARPVLA